jgi:hypothetical protein
MVEFRRDLPSIVGPNLTIPQVGFLLWNHIGILGHHLEEINGTSRGLLNGTSRLRSHIGSLHSFYFMKLIFCNVIRKHMSKFHD